MMVEGLGFQDGKSRSLLPLWFIGKGRRSYCLKCFQKKFSRLSSGRVEPLCFPRNICFRETERHLVESTSLTLGPQGWVCLGGSGECDFSPACFLTEPLLCLPVSTLLPTPFTMMLCSQLTMD